MFFYLAKTLGFMAHLPHLLLEAALLGCLLGFTRWRRAGRLITVASVVILAICSFLPVSALVVRPLENRFPQPELTQAPTGIIVLGGAVNEGVAKRRGQPALNEAAERMTEAVALMRRYPDAKLVFSGGSNQFWRSDATESQVARSLWTSLGVPADHMAFEEASRDTWENAVRVKEMIAPKPGESWLLVTSAMHMPRSMGIFRQVGFPVIAYPVDYRTGGGPGDFIGFRSMARSLLDLEQGSHEWIGLLAYYVRGKSNALFPAP